MFINPHAGAELGRQRQQEIRAQAGRQRLARRRQATPGTTAFMTAVRLPLAGRYAPIPGTDKRAH